MRRASDDGCSSDAPEEEPDAKRFRNDSDADSPDHVHSPHPERRASGPPGLTVDDGMWAGEPGEAGEAQGEAQAEEEPFLPFVPGAPAFQRRSVVEEHSFLDFGAETSAADQLMIVDLNGRR